MKNIRISKIEIHQIGPFGDLTLEFPEKPAGMDDKAEVHILTGENGTGKTTVLEMLADAIDNRYSMVANLPEGKYRKKNSVGEYKVYLTKDNFVEIKESLHSGNGKMLFKIRDEFSDSYLHFSEKPFYFALFSYSGHREISDKNITGVQELKGNPLEGANNLKSATSTVNILQWITNNIASKAIAQSQGNNNLAEQYQKNIEQLEQTISDIINKSVKFKLDISPYKIQIEVDGELLDFSLLPDGLKSIISWLSDLLMRMDRVKWVDNIPVFQRNFILFLDEIEVHLHPAWQRKILPVVQRLFPNAQIFLTTHSPFVIGSVDGAWIHKLVKPNGDSHLEIGYPVLSEDEKTYDYWLEEVFGIHEKYGLKAQDEFERRRELLHKKDISSAENEELKALDEQFGLLSPEDSPLGQRIIEHLKKLKTEQTKA